MIYVEMMADRTDKIATPEQAPRELSFYLSSESPSNQPSSEHKSLIEIYANDLWKVDFVKPSPIVVNSLAKENSVWRNFGQLRQQSYGWLMDFLKQPMVSKFIVTDTAARENGIKR